MKGGKQKIGKPGAGSLETFLTTDGIRMGTGWDQAIGLLSLIQIVSVKSVVNWFGSYQDIFDHGWEAGWGQDGGQGIGAKR
jgi:hypothetical protein